MKSYIVCPECGTLLGKAGKMESYETSCFKCRQKLLINVDEQNCAITRLEGKDELVCSQARYAVKHGKNTDCR